ncbi:tetratricopeptide repeat protein [Paludisphaera borealis]|uniref:Lipopolysaccharide assembly protein B n=1 Tax=Paludisphaera borealis TaxID=1387353 RepID=A0A1U7CUD7_9BACT|nr:tetratricopeptide repeat protein [Paludisphaera borealis]APW62557.1 Lipopolysaccharide assembly protein B [Paludisphaera borealis]
MRRGALIVLLSGLLGLLPVISGCGWTNTRRPSLKDVPTPEQAAQAQAFSERAQEAVDRGDLELAKVELTRLVAISPRSPEGHQRLGRVFEQQNRVDEAEACYSRALQLDPDYVGALIGMGRVEVLRGNPQSALKRFETAIEIEPHEATAHLALGAVFESLGRTGEAQAAYFRSLENDPLLGEASRRIAALQIARNEADQALARLDQTIELAPGDAEALLLRGRAHLALRHITPAIVDLRAAAVRLPNRPDVHFNLALALEAASQPGDALKSAEQALQLAPDYADARDLSQRLRR